MPKLNEAAIRKAAKPATLIALILTAAVLCCAIIVSVTNVKAVSSSFSFAKKYIRDMSDDEMYDALSDFVNESISPYERKDLAEAKIRQLLESGEISVARADNFKETAPTFNIYLDGKKLFKLSLKKTGILDIRAWRVASLSVSEDIGLGNPITLDVPSGATVTVNGTELDRYTSMPTQYLGLSEFELSLSDKYKSDSYDLGRFFTTPDVSVVYDGIRLQASSVSDGTLNYSYPSSMTMNYTYTVPYGATLTLNGNDVGREYIVENGIAYPFLTKFEQASAGIPTSSVYQISGLFEAPSVTVTYAGEELTDEDGIYRLPSTIVNSYVIEAPDYATVKVNGITLSESEISKKKQELPILNGVSGYAKSRPYLTQYTVSGLINIPEITAFDKSGKPLSVSSYYSSDGKIVFCLSDSGTPSSSVMKSLNNYSKAYVKYIYGGNSSLASNYDNVTQYTPYASPAYASLKAAYSSLYNAPIYKDISYGELKVIEYHAFSQSSYCAVIELPFTATLDGQEVSVTVTMEILGNFSGTRKFINYSILDTK